MPRKHDLEVLDADGRQFCTRCGTADSDELAKPCRAPSDEALAADELQRHIYRED